MAMVEGGFAVGPIAELTAVPGEAPLSPESRRIAEELAALERDIQEQQEAARRQRRDATQRLVELTGTTALVGHVAGDRAEICGGQYVTADSLEGFGEGLVTNVVALVRIRNERALLWERYERRWQLQEELTRQRLLDAERQQPQKSPTGN